MFQLFGLNFEPNTSKSYPLLFKLTCITYCRLSICNLGSVFLSSAVLHELLGISCSSVFHCFAFVLVFSLPHCFRYQMFSIPLALIFHQWINIASVTNLCTQYCGIIRDLFVFIFQSLSFPLWSLKFIQKVITCTILGIWIPVCLSLSHSFVTM